MKTILKIALVLSLMGNSYFIGTLQHDKPVYDTKGFAALADSRMPIEFIDGGK